MVNPTEAPIMVFDFHYHAQKLMLQRPGASASDSLLLGLIFPPPAFRALELFLMLLGPSKHPAQAKRLAADATGSWGLIDWLIPCG